MEITAKPEILRPRSTRAGAAFTDENLEHLSHLLDDFIHIPGTPIRFGLDGIVGFIPGVGDILGGLASTIIIIAAWVRGVPKAIVARMVINVAIETAVGSLPVVGNLFDIGWRANRRNYKLLESSIREPGQQSRSGWLFLAGMCVVLALLMMVPLVLAGFVVVGARHLLGR